MQFFFDILNYLVWEKVINNQTIPDSIRIKFMLRNNCKILLDSILIRIWCYGQSLGIESRYVGDAWGLRS